MRRLLIIVMLLSLSRIALAAGFPRFEETTIDAEAAQRAVYAVTLADVDGDGRDDIVAVNETQVAWYRNPGWEKQILIDGQTEPDNVCIAPHDIDGDGRVDFALGAGWTKVGTIQWISRGSAPGDRWSVHSIAVEPWTHRMRWGDVLGKGRPQLVVSPLNATQGNGVRLLAFEVPADPTRGPWPSTVLDESLNQMHNHWHLTLENGATVTLTASQEGVIALARSGDGSFLKMPLGAGFPGDTPKTSGAGEVKPVRLQGESLFAASIEPMHGTSVVVYRWKSRSDLGQLGQRLVIDDTLKAGHALWAADLDGDGNEEIIAGQREAGEGEVKGPDVYVYTADSPAGTAWTRHVIDDGGMACEDLVCGDVDGDGRIDIIAGGRATQNVKLYLNRR